MLRKLVLAFAITLLPLSVQAAQQERTDLQVVKDISTQVLTYTRFTVFDAVNASLEHGEVTLTGKVTMPYKRDDIERRVAKVPGVRSIQNRIEVLPVSYFDDELRFRIARAIYGNSSFWGYASMANPPIHILVEGGHVTLTGVVNNDVERMLARSLASSFGAFSVANELRTDAEMKAALSKMH